MLPDELIEKFLKHSDPDVAGAAKTLKDIKSQGLYLPKDKFDAVNTAKSDLEKALQGEKDRIAALESRITTLTGEKDQATKDLLTQLDTEKREREKVLKQLESLKPSADEYEKFRVAKREALKTKLGDKYLSEYDSFSVASLDKLLTDAGQQPHDVDGHQPGKLFKKPLSDQSPQEFEKTVADAKAGRLK